MVKHILFLSLALSLFSCSEEKQETNEGMDTEQFEAKLPLVVEDENGRYTEWYPGREQVKMKGTKDKEGRKIGIWKYYTERGVEQSITEYKSGKKDGISVVRHPNGTIYYRGQYEMDKPSGVWKFYNDQGQLIERKFYDEE
jgi:antitoxin component YwqK of YwqJK toxin-antitoxin module